MPSPNEPSPRPWRVNTPMMSAPWKEGNPHIYDAKGVGVAIVGIGKSPDVNSANAALIVDAVNNADSWRDAYIKARTERNAFLLERDRLRDIINRLIVVRENVFWRRDEKTGLNLECRMIDEEFARKAIADAKAAIAGEESK